MHSILYVIQYIYGEDSSNAMMNLSDAKSSVTQNSICHCVVCILHFCFAFCSVWIIIDGNVMFIVLFIMLTTCTNTHFEYILSWMVFILPNGKTSALNQIKWKSPTKSQYVKKLYSVSCEINMTNMIEKPLHKQWEAIVCGNCMQLK